MEARTIFVFFDLGETLVDLKDLVACIAARLREEYAQIAGAADETARVWIRRTSDSLPRAEGAPFAPEIAVAAIVLSDLLRARGLYTDAARAKEILRQAWDEYEKQVRFCPGVSPAWLEELRNLVAGLGIVTDGDQENVDRLVRRLNIAKHFEAIITSESVRAYKPNPRIYEAALKALGAESHRSLFVSDTSLDLRGAAAVGMRTAILHRGLLSEPMDLPATALRLSNPGQLTEILRGRSR